MLPMFQLDALVLIRVNKAKSWGTSIIYSYVEACQRTVLLIAHIGILIDCPIYNAIAWALPAQTPECGG